MERAFGLARFQRGVNRFRRIFRKRAPVRAGPARVWPIVAGIATGVSCRSGARPDALTLTTKSPLAPLSEGSWTGILSWTVGRLGGGGIHAWGSLTWAL